MKNHFSLRVGLVILSALLASAAFPPLNASWLVLFAWVPLFVALDGTSLKCSLVLGGIHGFTFFAVGACWMPNVFGVLCLPLWCVLASFTVLFAGLCNKLKWERPWACLLGATLWTGIEYFRSELFILDFPWLTPGVGFAPSRLSPIVGTYGVSFLVVFTSMLLVGSIKKKSNLPLAGVLFVMLSMAQIWKLTPNHEGADIPVLAVQDEKGTLEDLMELTLDGVKGSTQEPALVVWPEHAITVDEGEVPYANVLACAEQFDAVLVAGTTTLLKGEYFNTAVAVEGAKVLGVHFKNHLVPIYNGGNKGTEAVAIQTSIGKVGTPVCYDCDHYDVIRHMVADGAQLLAVPSRDNIHWGRLQHVQHSQLFLHRAAENNRWVVVAASSGVTQIVDPWGNQVDTIDLITPGVLRGAVGLLETRTFFNRYGYLFGGFCFYVSCGFILYLLSRIVFDFTSRRKP